MLTLLLGMAILAVGWLAAPPLASGITNLFLGARLEERLARHFNTPVDGSITSRAGRLVFYLVRLVSVGLALAIAFGMEPFHNIAILTAYHAGAYEPFNYLPLPPQEMLAILLAAIVGFQLIHILNRFFFHFARKIEEWRYTRLRKIRVLGMEVFTPNTVTNSLIVTARYLRVALILVVIALCSTLLFSYYPETRLAARALTRHLIETLDQTWATFVQMLPNIVTLVIITVLARYSLKLLQFLADGFRKGKIKHQLIHPELAQPTFQLIRFLVIAFAIVAAFPFIPGSDSPVFRGLSIFIGFLLSMGSTSLVTNVVSGVVLTYTRGLRVGDRVQIAEAVGDVVERTLLVTRIRTIKNVDITIPNGMVLNNHIINFSTSAEESGLILHTTVTIGYDVPWRQVHELLIDAALSTAHIMEYPQPFVLQTSLDDYYVSYELNAYTMRPKKMAPIYSSLHQNIQDNFNEAEVEILSPSFAAVRDGGEPGIPHDYLPKQYATRPVKTYPWPNANR